MYKKFLIKLFLLLLLLFILYGLFVLYFYKRPISTNWINQAYIKKELYANSIKKNKIVFTGGSNVLMGIKTQKVEEVLKIPSVNYGVHAGLRTSYIIYKTKQILKPGDIVIMPLEYSNINWNGIVNDTLVGYILTKDRKYFNSLSLMLKIKMLYSITPYKFFKMYISMIPSIRKKLVKKGYNAKTINKNGDETANIGAKYFHIYTSIKLPKEKLKKLKGINEIINFNKWCIRHHIKFYLTYPNILQIKNFNTQKYHIYINNLKKIMFDNNVSFIGNAQSAFYKQNDMYDSKYHLNQKGQKKRTNYIINLVKEKIICKINLN